MKIATTLIVVTLAVVGSNVESQDPAFAQSKTEKVSVQNEKGKGQDKTLAKESSKSKNTVSVEITLGTPAKNKVYAEWYIKDKYGWGKKQYRCLARLWGKESAWNHKAHNEGSGAYGIPQSLPADKMASSGKDWKTNPATQIEWGTKYIKLRYGNPCGAFAHFNLKNWY